MRMRFSLAAVAALAAIPAQAIDLGAHYADSRNGFDRGHTARILNCVRIHPYREEARHRVGEHKIYISCAAPLGAMVR